MPIESLQQLLAWKPERKASIVEDGILLPETRLMIFGQAKAWKSMLSLYTSFTLGDGLPWFGYKTAKSTVLKIQVELPKLADRDRADKFSAGSKSYPSTIFFETPRERMKLDTTPGITALNKSIDELKRRCPGHYPVLILDPAYKLMAGHISDEYDVKKFQDNIDESKDKYHYSIILIHHSRLTKVDASGNIVDLGAEEVMGSSYWNNWCDTMIRCKLLNPQPYGAGNLIEVSFELTRNADKLLPSFQVRWSRGDLQPTVVKRDLPAGDDISVKDLRED